MKRICTQCQTEMIEECGINVEGVLYGIKIKQYGKKLFNVSSKLKAAICPNCGCVVLYTDEYDKFKK